MKAPFLILLLALASGCSYKQGNENTVNGKSDDNHTPPSGTVLAADSVLIPDPLNKLQFSVRIVANDNSRNGSYNVVASYGYNQANGRLTMPKADKPLRPVIVKGKDPFTFVIGFHYGRDARFHDYFLVAANRGMIQMKYLKAYSFN